MIGDDVFLLVRELPVNVATENLLDQIVRGAAVFGDYRTAKAATLFAEKLNINPPDQGQGLCA